MTTEQVLLSQKQHQHDSVPLPDYAFEKNAESFPCEEEEDGKDQKAAFERNHFQPERRL